MYRDVSWRGRTLVLESGRGYDDLTELSMDWFSDWNDKASSLASSDLIGVYGEHTNFEGSRLVVNSHTPYENLGDLGWNDRISSALAG
jgi:hypothetical protein